MACSNVRTSAGTRIHISSTLVPCNYTAIQMAALPWIEIGEVSDLGEFGREYNVVNFNPLGDRKTVKRKGSYNDGTVSMQVAKVGSDGGQQICKTALDSDSSYPFRITLQDGTVFYFTAQVTSFTTNVGSVDQITSAAINLEIDNNIIEAAAPASIVTAIATAVLDIDEVDTVTVVNGGSGYTVAPAITFTGGGGSGATATATITGGVVTAITVTNGGSGYTSAPTVVVTP